MQQDPIREAVGIFDSERKLDAAIAELEGTAFPRHDISVAGRDYKYPAGLSPSAYEMEDDPDAPRHVPIMPEEKNIGAAFLTGVCAYIGGCIAAFLAHALPPVELLVAITGGSLAGGAIGFGLMMLVREFIKRDVQKQLNKGGLVLWVHTVSARAEETACAIMRKHGGRHVHVHSIR